MPQLRVVILAAALVLAPLVARAADLVVWWEKGYHPEEDAAVREIIAAFETKTGKEVELVLHPQEELPRGLSQSLKMVVERAGRGRMSHRLYEGSPA